MPVSTAAKSLLGRLAGPPLGFVVGRPLAGKFMLLGVITADVHQLAAVAVAWAWAWAWVPLLWPAVAAARGPQNC